MKNLIVVILCVTSLCYADEPKTSYEKIAKDLENNLVTGAESVGLRVLAFFDELDLPEKYHSDRGSVVKSSTDNLLSEARNLLTKMSPLTAAKVFRYMVPPAYLPEAAPPAYKLDLSYLLNDATDILKPQETPNQEWAFVEDLTTEVRIWYKRDDDEQYQAVQRIKRYLWEEIIPAEKRLMGRTHLRDDVSQWKITVQEGIERPLPNGGDGKFDIYLYNMPRITDPGHPLFGKEVKGWVNYYGVDSVPGFGCPAEPTFMSLNASWVLSASQKEVSSTVAHEYFHVIQHAHNRKATCADYFNIDESVATYIKDYVYPKYNTEHEWYEFFENGRLSLKDAQYGGWTFFRYLVEMHGSDIIRSLYAAMSTEKAWDAVNKVVNGGFKKQWLGYSIYEWNQEPLFDGFFSWDDFKFVPGRGVQVLGSHLPKIQIENVNLDANGTYRKEMDLKLKPLTRDFYAFELKEPDVRSIAIENPSMMSTSRVQVKALVRKRGQSKFDEIKWESNSRHEYQYCLDKKDEDIDLIVIVIANHRHESTAPLYEMKPSFTATNQGCHGFKGKLKTNYDQELPGVEHHLQVDATDLVFTDLGRVNDGLFKGHFRVESGIISYNYTGSIGDCKGKKSGNLAVSRDPKNISITLAPYNVPPAVWGKYDVSVELDDPEIMITYECPAPQGGSFDLPIHATVTTGIHAQDHKGNSRLIGNSEGGGLKSSWEFKPFKETPQSQ